MNTDKTAQVEGMFRIIGKITIGAVLFLILVGGIVRSTGAGMGCPDWPKCFGMWVPPTDVAELPANYQEIYADHGYASMAFNPVKTWIEYVNRLIGALIGLFVFATAITSLTYWRRNRKITVLSIAAFLLTGLQGWLGAKVVELNLAGWMVTVHMLFALIIVMFLMAAVLLEAPVEDKKASSKASNVPAWLKYLSSAVMILLLVQILMGTQVRENVDAVAEAMSFEDRGSWIGQLGGWFDWHRIFSILPVMGIVLMTNGILKYFKENASLKFWVLALLGLVFAEMLLGIGLSGLELPAWMQPLHLLFASLIFTVQFGLLLYIHRYSAALANASNQKYTTEFAS